VREEGWETQGPSAKAEGNGASARGDLEEERGGREQGWETQGPSAKAEGNGASARGDLEEERGGREQGRETQGPSAKAEGNGASARGNRVCWRPRWGRSFPRPSAASLAALKTVHSRS
jgi:hypothetical protein